MSSSPGSRKRTLHPLVIGTSPGERLRPTCRYGDRNVEARMSVRVRDTVDHDEIRRWIQLHHGAPARVSDPRRPSMRSS